MIRSMTAFLRHEIHEKNWTATWEIRSTNHRYLELHIYLPDTLRDLETDIRKRITNPSNISRGRIECKLHINTNYNDIQNIPIILNTKLIEELIQSIKNIPNQKNIKKIDPIKILSWPGVIIKKTNNLCKMYPQILQSFDKILDQFIKTREHEGTDLEKTIRKRLSKIQREIYNIKKEVPSVILYHKKKLLKKIQETNISINNNRLEEELLIYAQRADISEEIDRLEIHMSNINLILTQEKIVGRKLDFITQELYREINTITSKSMNILITQSSIEIKILIDQIREQIQNIE